MNHIKTLEEIVKQAFDNAIANPTVARWKSCAIVAGCAAVRLASDGFPFAAAQLEGVADEARRQMIEMQKVTA